MPFCIPTRKYESPEGRSLIERLTIISSFFEFIVLFSELIIEKENAEKTFLGENTKIVKVIKKTIKALLWAGICINELNH